MRVEPGPVQRIQPVGHDVLGFAAPGALMHSSHPIGRCRPGRHDGFGREPVPSPAAGVEAPSLVICLVALVCAPSLAYAIVLDI